MLKPSKNLYIFWILAVTFIYSSSANFGILFKWQPEFVNDIWSPTAIGFTAVFLLGYRLCLGVWLGSFWANIIFLSYPHSSGNLWHILWISASIACGKTLAIFVSCFLLRKLIGTRNLLFKVHDILIFMLVGLLGCSVSASINFLVVYFSKTSITTSYIMLWLIWLFRDLSGLLTLTPALLIFGHGFFPKGYRRIIEFIGSLFIFTIINEALFNDKYFFSQTDLHVSYLPLVLTMWITYRFGYGGAIAATLLTLLISLKGTIHGFGAFAGNNLANSLFFLQLFITTLSGTSLLLAGALYERKVAEEILKNELNQSARLATLGTLAASVAHELRNPLNVIQMAVHNIKNKHKDFSEDKHLENIQKKVNESNRIIEDLLSYTRIKMPKYGPCVILSLLDECIENLKEQFQALNVAVEKDYKVSHDFVIEVDSGHIQEVFVNVLSNAYQAMEDRKGRIKVTVFKKSHEYIQISIQDSGVGISAENLEKIFRPFFTTKKKGTGLGLPICSELISLHHGRMDVHSIEGQGTTFDIIVPIKRKILG